MSFNISLLPKKQQDDMALEKRAAMLVRQVKNDQKSKKFVKSELAREEDPQIKARFKFYLNKYRLLERKTKRKKL